MMRRFYALLTFLTITICMYGFTVDGLNYETLGENKVMVTGLENESFSGELVIPESVTYNNVIYKVTDIQAGAFRGNQGITSVALSNSLEGIYYAAFYQCTNLSSFSIPNSVVHIGLHAFEGTGWYNNQPDGAIYKDNVLLGYKKNKPEGDFIIAEGTRVIADGACFDTDITSVQFPKTVEAIGQQAFQGCWQLSSIRIPNSVKLIDFRAFAECSKLTEIYSQIEEPFALADEAFRYKYINAETYYNRVTLYVPVGTKAKYEATDGWKEFKNIVEMEPYDVLGDNTVAAHFLEPDEEGKIEIPETVEIDGKTYTVTEIAANAFKDNKELTEVTIPGTVTTIGDGAFAGCENLRAIYVFAPEPISLTAAEARSIVTRAAENVPSQFEGIDFDACTLYVPIGSEQKYRDAEGWKLFVNIVGVEDPAGIATVYTEQNGNEPIYNLSGQRLAAPRRGLNIIGGRKVVMK